MLVSESKFECKVGDQTFEVLEYEYDAGLSRPYLARVTFISLNPDLDFKSFINKNATLSVNIQGATSTSYINGIVSGFSQMGQIGDRYSYSINIEPKIVNFKYQEKTDVYLNQNIPDIVKSLFKKTGITQVEFQLSNTYPTRNFVCQFQETDFNFIFRWLEYEGIYYYFEQSSSSEKLILIDKNTTHKNHKDFASLQYTQGKNIIDNGINNIDAFSAHNHNVAKMLTLKGYNYSNNTQTISGEAEISIFGNGIMEIFDENVLTEAEAQSIAKVRAEEISGMEQVFSGKTLNPSITPGFIFSLKGHFRNSYNHKYMVFDIFQRGSQKEKILAKYGNYVASDSNRDTIVTTDFKAIPNSSQFRPKLNTAVKKMSGIIPALIDAETSGDTPHLDGEGRYKIRMLYSDKSAGQASDWVRKMESYIGENYGSHYPILKNGEACIGFQFGNPDRPIIMGMLQNSTNKNLVTSENNSDIVLLSTPRGNKITASDVPGKEHVTIYSPYSQATSVIGYSGHQSWHKKDWIWSRVPTPEKCGSWTSTTKSKASQIFADTYTYQEGDSFSVVKGIKVFTANMVSELVKLTLGGVGQNITVVADYTKGIFSGGFHQLIMTGIVTRMIVTGLNIDYIKSGKTINFMGDDFLNSIKGNYVMSVENDIKLIAGTGISISGGTGININSPSKINMMSGEECGTHAMTINSRAEASNTISCGASSIEVTPEGIFISSGASLIKITPAGIALVSGGSTLDTNETGIIASSPILDIL